MKKVEFIKAMGNEIEFSQEMDNEVEVMVNSESYGFIRFDTDQNAWVLWPEEIEDGVTYFEDLEETKEAITDEIQNVE